MKIVLKQNFLRNLTLFHRKMYNRIYIGGKTIINDDVLSFLSIIKKETGLEANKLFQLPYHMNFRLHDK